MSEMVERVANAIGSHISNRDRTLTPWTMIAARAAIEAMREPTDAMKLAGQALAYEGWGDGSEIAKLSWQTMIDAALREKP